MKEKSARLVRKGCGNTRRKFAVSCGRDWPSATEVAAVRDQFRMQSAAPSEARDTTLREQADIERLMPDVIAAVKDLWDIIEFNLRNEPTNPGRRRRAREWGVICATRPGAPPDPDEPPAGTNAGGTPANRQG